MGFAINEFTRTDSELIHVICWSSVNKSTDTGVFSIKTGHLQHIEDFRDIIRRMFIEGRCFETFPRLAILKKFQLSAYFPKSTSRIDNQKLCDWVMSCNEGLKGEIAPIDVKYFPAGHPRKGARVIIFSGCQAFLDSLQCFPKDYPFNIRITYI